MTHALDHFIDSDLLIVGEIVIEAAHALLTHTGTTAGHRTRVRAPGGGGALRGGAGRGGGRGGHGGGAVGGGRGGDGARRLHAAPRWRRRWRPSCSTWWWRSRASTTGRSTSRASWCWGGSRRAATGDDATSLLIGLDDKPGRLGEVLNRLGGRGPQPAAHRLAPDRPARAARSVFPGSRRAPGRSRLRGGARRAGRRAAAAEGARFVSARSRARGSHERAATLVRAAAGADGGHRRRADRRLGRAGRARRGRGHRGRRLEPHHGEARPRAGAGHHRSRARVRRPRRRAARRWWCWRRRCAAWARPRRRSRASWTTARWCSTSAA